MSVANTADDGERQLMNIVVLRDVGHGNHNDDYPSWCKRGRFRLGGRGCGMVG